jgi:hypothetical protein
MTPELDKGSKLARMPELNEESKLARTHELNKGSKLARMHELNKGSKLARTHELNKGSKLARTYDLDKGSKLARTPELNKGGELAETSELLWVFAFAAIVWVVPLPLQLPVTTFGIIAPTNLRLMAATGILPRDVVIALVFAATAVVAAALTFRGGGG